MDKPWRPRIWLEDGAFSYRAGYQTSPTVGPLATASPDAYQWVHWVGSATMKSETLFFTTAMSLRTSKEVNMTVPTNSHPQHAQHSMFKGAPVGDTVLHFHKGFAGGLVVYED